MMAYVVEAQKVVIAQQHASYEMILSAGLILFVLLRVAGSRTHYVALRIIVLYICVEEPSYTGEQIMPSGEAVRVYIGSPQAVKAASQAKEKNDSILTDPNQSYKLTRLSEGKDYTLSYGKNVAAGKNKGSLTVNGLAPQYGGSVQVKFTILGKGIYK